MKDEGITSRINLKIVFMAVLLLLFVIVGFAAIKTLTAEKQVEIYNIDQVDSGLTSQEIRELEDFIGQSLQNSQGYDANKKGIVALIRPSSFEKIEENEIKNYSFLVDVDELKVTYKVSFALVGDEGFYESPIVDCPAPELMKYPETYCKSEKTSMLTVTVGQYLPYYFHLDTGELVTVTFARTDEGQEYLNMRVGACGNQETIQKSRTQVEDWIKSLDYEPSDYEIKTVDFCDGEVH